MDVLKLAFLVARVVVKVVARNFVKQPPIMVASKLVLLPLVGGATWYGLHYASEPVHKVLITTTFSVALNIAFLPVVGAVLWFGLHHAIQPVYKVHNAGGVVITGASSGIGKDAAVSLARKGYMVYAGVRKQTDAEALEKLGIASLKPVVGCDVTKQDTINEAVKFVEKDLSGRPLVALVNNAGISKNAPIELMDVDRDAKASFDVNYSGVVRATKAFLPLLRKTGEGARIVQISSVSGLLVQPDMEPYGGAKWALESMSGALRREVSRWKISVSVINPGMVKTDIFGKGKEHRKDLGNKDPTGLYKHLLNAAADNQMLDACERADMPQVTTDAIEHAITSPTPQVRYVCANIAGVPANHWYWLQWLLPDRLMDKVSGPLFFLY